MSTPWKSTIKHIIDGEAVSADITNRPDVHLEQRTSHLKERLDAAAAGQALIEFSTTLDSTTIVGHAVYKTDAGVWTPGLAATENSSSIGHTLSRSAYIQGVVLAKHTATLGDVVLFGRVSGVDWSAAVDGGAVVEGQYYLSGSNAGKMTLQKPPAGVPVAILLPGVGEAFVNVSPRDVLEDHIHYSVSLEDNPAGVIDCISSGQTHTIRNPDPNSMGWLPANHSSFNSTAPVGAVFGYNMAAHSELFNIWPPVPPDSIYLEIDGVGVPLGFDSGVPPDAKVLINRYGIWWMEGCYGGAPWADPYPICTNDQGATITTPFGDPYYFPPPGCPEPYRRKLMLYFSKMVYKTSASVVTSLEPESGSIITVKDQDGLVANTGNLRVGADLNLTVNTGVSGYQVLKSVTGTVFDQGPVISSVKAADSSVIITGGTAPDSTGKVFGDVSISVANPFASGRDLEVQLIGLSQATQEQYQNILFLGLPAAVDSDLRLKASIPAQAVTTSGTLTFKLWVLGTVGATSLPSLSSTYRRVLPPTAGAIALPTTDTVLDTSISLSLPSSYVAYQYFEVTTGTFTVTGGDIVFLTLKRTGSTDGYSGIVGLVKIVPLLTAT